MVAAAFKSSKSRLFVGFYPDLDVEQVPPHLVMKKQLPRNGILQPLHDCRGSTVQC